MMTIQKEMSIKMSENEVKLENIGQEEIKDDSLSDNKEIKCEICGKTFKNKNSLGVHKSRFHRKNNDNKKSEIKDKEDNYQRDYDEDKNKETINITEESFSQEDLDKAKSELDKSIDNDENVQQVKEILENMTEEDGKELYIMLMDIVGGLSGIDVEDEIPNLENRATKRGKYLAYTINRYIPQIEQYLIPIMLMGGIGLDILTIRKMGKMKKGLENLKTLTRENEGDKK
uniref:AMDV5_1 n=1 Tax=uncultured virus TaxID=340016 RepID=B3GAN3_9VIRU|nr:AMDV5_1 [uncultured virus]